MNMRDEFLSLLSKYKTAVGNGDHDAVTKLFTDDAVLLEPGVPPVVGRQQIHGLYQNWLGDGVTVEIELQGFEGIQDIIYGWGTYESGETKGNWLEVLRRQHDGQLLIHRLCTNQI